MTEKESQQWHKNTVKLIEHQVVLFVPVGNIHAHRSSVTQTFDNIELQDNLTNRQHSKEKCQIQEMKTTETIKTVDQAASSVQRRTQMTKKKALKH